MPVIAEGLTCLECGQEVRECRGIIFPHWNAAKTRACPNSLKPAGEPHAYYKTWMQWPDGVSPFLSAAQG